MHEALSHQWEETKRLILLHRSVYQDLSDVSNN